MSVVIAAALREEASRVQAMAERVSNPDDKAALYSNGSVTFHVGS